MLLISYIKISFLKKTIIPIFLFSLVLLIIVPFFAIYEYNRSTISSVNRDKTSTKGSAEERKFRFSTSKIMLFYTFILLKISVEYGDR